VEKDDNPKHLHIDNFPEDVKKEARKKAMDTHSSFKRWVIDIFRAAITGEAHGGFRVIYSQSESGQGTVRPGAATDVGKASAEDLRNKKRERQPRKKA